MPKHYAIKKEYPSLSRRIVTEAEVISVSGFGNKKIKVNALWDTGATDSAIIPSVAKNLNLISIDRCKLNSINKSEMAGIVKITVDIPNLGKIENIRVAVCNLIKGVDMLIGMDIIQRGDLSISNGEGKTLFTFAVPPFKDKVDLCKKANEENNK